MKHFIFSALIFSLIACNNQADEQQQATTDSNDFLTDSPMQAKEDSTISHGSVTDSTFYSNERFRDAHVQKLNDTTFKITGKARVFEANFEWHVKEDNVVIKKGHTTTDAGAPEFGNFNFTITAKRKNPSSKLEILIFEPSANDGTPQGELLMPLN